MKLLQDKTCVLLINHYMTRAKGSEETDQRTLNFMLDKVSRIVHIAHPFPNSPFNETVVEFFEGGKLIKEERISIFKLPQILQYLIHFFLTWWIFLRIHYKFDLCITLENLSFINLFPLRMLRLIKRIVYYSVDFSPQRFQNPILNNAYHTLDKFACLHSDMNWMMVEEQIEARRIRDGKNMKYSPFSLAPIGYKQALIKLKTIEEIDFYNLIFAGALLENSGPHLGIKALPQLIKIFPKIHYTIIGRGVFENELRNLVKILGLEKKVKFTGYIDSFGDLTETISKGSIGLAPFVPNPNSLSFYSDPSKIKLYLVSGLPVITTKVTTIAPLLEKAKAGLVIEYNERDLYKAVEYLLSDRKRYKSYKKAAVQLSQRYDIDNILTEAFKKIPS